MKKINEFITYFDGLGSYIDPKSNVCTYQMGLCDLQYNKESNTLKVVLRNPGLLIGKQGKQIKELENHLNCKILIEEKTFLK